MTTAVPCRRTAVSLALAAALAGAVVLLQASFGQASVPGSTPTRLPLCLATGRRTRRRPRSSSSTSNANANANARNSNSNSNQSAGKRGNVSPSNGFGVADNTCVERASAVSSSSSASTTASATTTTTTTTKIDRQEADRQERIYSLPALYDLAFGYRSFHDEARFLVNQHRILHDGKPPRRIIELAAGPARHCVAALKSSMVESAVAVDSSASMVQYAKDVARQELSESLRSSFSIVQDDMCTFRLSNRQPAVDSAWIMLGSLQHLTTNERVIQCFRSVHNALAPTGTLIVELPHPREIFAMVECTRNGWQVPLEDRHGQQYGQLDIVWGDDNDVFDPITQVRQFTVSMQLTTSSTDGSNNTSSNSNSNSSNSQSQQLHEQSVKETVPMRHFTAQEIHMLAQLSGFSVRSMHGAVEDGVRIDDDDGAYRLVCVLQKV